MVCTKRDPHFSPGLKTPRSEFWLQFEFSGNSEASHVFIWTLVGLPPRTMGPAISVRQGGTGSGLQRAQPLFAAWYGFALNAPMILKSVTILHVTE